MKKLFTLIVLMLCAGLLWATGTTSNPHKVLGTSVHTYAYQDTVSLYGDADKDTIDYQLYSGDAFANGFFKISVYPDTGANKVALAATDSLYFIYCTGFGRYTYAANVDTILFPKGTRGTGLDWATDRWYYAFLGNSDNPVARSESLRIIVTHESSDDDSVDVIVRFEWGDE